MTSCAACAATLRPALRPKNELSPMHVPLEYPLASWAMFDAQAPAAYSPATTAPSSRSIIDHRMTALESRRLELLAEHETAGADDDVRALVELLVAPPLEIPADPRAESDRPA